MKLSVQQPYPATVARMWSVFSDPAYPAAKYRALGALTVDVARFVADAGEISVDLTRKIPVALDKLPGFARKLVGDEQTMRHETRWRRIADDDVRGALTITAVGRPVRIVGEAKLAPRGDGASELSFTFDITSDVPLIGGKVEKLFFDQVSAALAADHAYTLEHLARAP